MVRALIEYLYGHNYTRAEWRTESTFDFETGIGFADALLFHTHVYATAGLYLVPQLQEEASRRFLKILFLGCTSSKYFDFILEVVPAVYSATPESDRRLRRAVVLFARLRYRILNSEDHRDDLESLKEEYPDFANDVQAAFDKDDRFGSIRSLPINLVIGKCTNCGRVVDDEARGSGLVCPGCKYKTIKWNFDGIDFSLFQRGGGCSCQVCGLRCRLWQSLNPRIGWLLTPFLGIYSIFARNCTQWRIIGAGNHEAAVFIFVQSILTMLVVLIFAYCIGLLHHYWFG